jgi:hypothetical protein
LPEYPELTWNIYFQNGTDGTFIHESFRATDQSYDMASAKKDVERGAINGSSFIPKHSIMGCTHY